MTFKEILFFDLIGVWFQKIFWFIKLCRLRFLIYSPIMYAIGAGIANLEEKVIEPYLFLFGLLFVWNTHLMTHFFNDFYDYKADCNNKHPSPWTGGSRVFVENKLALNTGLFWGYFSCVLSLVFLLKFSPNVLSFFLGFLIIFLSYSYSSPPLKLEYRGLGELTVALVLNILVPIWGYSLFSSDFVNTEYFFLLIPISIIEYARMMVMNMPDRESDALSGKNTLIVRIGMVRAVKLYVALNVISYLSLLFFFGYIHINFLLSIYLTLPLCVWIMYRLLKGDWQNRETMYNIPFLASTHNGMVAAAYMFALTFESSFNSCEFLRYPLYLFISSLILFCSKFIFNWKNQ